MPESAQNILPQACVRQALEKCLLGYLSPTAPVCIAFSGGMDSSVLLHALSRFASERTVRAVHVDHGLQRESAAWAAACEQIGRDLQVPVKVVTAKVDLSEGAGLEAAARDARYAALAEQLGHGEVLLTAHHQRDQMETLLFRLLRGAGVQGLAAIPVHSQRGAMELLRPLLGVPADVIRSYAIAEHLDWIDDPTNAELAMDRNFLRHNVLPVLQGRWPAAEESVARAARLCAEAAEVLDDMAEHDLRSICAGDRLKLAQLALLSGARQRNVMRYALRSRGLAVPSEKQLRHALATLVAASGDTQPEAAWPGVRIRRYRNHLWIFAEDGDPLFTNAPADVYSWVPGKTLDLGPIRGHFRSESQQGGGIAAQFCKQPLELRFRQGGERLRIAPEGRTRELKNLLQETDIVPWMRGHIPLLYSGDRLLAVGDLWVNADYAARGDDVGMVLKWEGHTPIR